MDIFIGGVLIGLILGVWLSVAFFYFSLSRQKPRKQSAQPTFQLRLDTVEKREAFHHLVLMARGDSALAERLVHYEWRRTPHAPEIVLIHNAIDRWIQDNR